MIHEISIVLIYATFVMILISFYTKRVDRLEDRIVYLEKELDSIKSNLYIVDSEKGSNNNG